MGVLYGNPQNFGSYPDVITTLPISYYGTFIIGNGSMVGRGTQQDLYGGQPLKNIIVKKDRVPKVVVMKIGDMEINITFALTEHPGVKESVIEILTDSYEKKRLRETSGEKLGKI